jgi:hypothetical protein
MKRALLFDVMVLAIVAHAANMPDMPKMKEGLWLMRSQTIQQPSGEKTQTTATVCRNAGWNNVPMKVKTPKGKCKSSVDSSETTQKYEIACKVDEAAFKLTETKEITGEDMMRTVVDMTYSPPVDGVSGTTMIVEAAYISACPAGMKPGETLMPDGTFVNAPTQ